MKPHDFVEEFVLPLVAGGTLHVGAPLGRAGYDKLRDTKIAIELDGAILEARSAIAGELLVDAVPPLLDAEALRLAVAVHDMLFLFHPGAEAISVRDRRLDQVAQFAGTLASLTPSRDPQALVARHTMLHLLPSLARTDVQVSFWVGKREFHGEEPPRRLVAWPNLRRVRQERRRVNCFAESASHPLAGGVVQQLLEGSPLTDLLHPVRLEPRFSLGKHADTLFEPELARLVAYAWLDAGLPKVGGAIAGAVLAELDGESRRQARFACAFLAHLHLCTLMGPQSEPRDPRAPRTVARFAVGGDPGLRDFYGLFAALHKEAPDLSAPADVLRDRSLSKKVDEHALACAAACGVTRVRELGTLVARAVGTIALAASNE
jgi:hypothetical protein